MIYIGRVRREELIEGDQDSDELDWEKLNQDGPDLEESAKEGKAIGAFGEVESRGAREEFLSDVLKAQNDYTKDSEAHVQHKTCCKRIGVSQ